MRRLRGPVAAFRPPALRSRTLSPRETAWLPAGVTLPSSPTPKGAARPPRSSRRAWTRVGEQVRLTVPARRPKLPLSRPESVGAPRPWPSAPALRRAAPVADECARRSTPRPHAEEIAVSGLAQVVEIESAFGPDADVAPRDIASRGSAGELAGRRERSRGHRRF